MTDLQVNPTTWSPAHEKTAELLRKTDRGGIIYQTGQGARSLALWVAIEKAAKLNKGITVLDAALRRHLDELEANSFMEEQGVKVLFKFISPEMLVRHPNSVDLGNIIIASLSEFPPRRTKKWAAFKAIMEKAPHAIYLTYPEGVRLAWGLEHKFVPADFARLDLGVRS